MSNSAHDFTASFTQDEISLSLSSLRHDLRNTMRPLVELPKWICEDLRESGIVLDPQTLEHFDMLDTYGARLSQMIEDLLNYAHVGHEGDDEFVAPSTIFDQLTQGIDTDALQINGRFDHDVLPIPFRDLHRLMDALLSNAIKHHDRDHGTIHVSCHQTDLVVQLTVADDGPGIHSNNHSDVFLPLKTLNSRDDVEGSGMGLALVKRIAHRYGGEVKLISPGDTRGTCVIVWFEKQTV